MIGDGEIVKLAIPIRSVEQIHQKTFSIGLTVARMVKHLNARLVASMVLSTVNGAKPDSRISSDAKTVRQKCRLMQQRAQTKQQLTMWHGHTPVVQQTLATKPSGVVSEPMDVNEMLSKQRLVRPKDSRCLRLCAGLACCARRSIDGPRRADGSAVDAGDDDNHNSTLIVQTLEETLCGK